MCKPIKYEFGFDGGSLGLLNLLQNGCLNLGNWNLTFKWIFFVSEGLFDSICQFDHIDDFVAKEALHLLTQE